jgi:putative DNA primase/helicase
MTMARRASTKPSDTVAVAPSDKADVLARVNGEAPKPTAASLCLDDIGNAERFVRQHGANVRYVAVHDRWYIWDGKRFRADDVRAVEQLAKATARSIYNEAANCKDDGLRAKIAEHAKASAALVRVRAMITLARSDPRVAARPGDFDRDRMLLNCNNGTIDLRTGQLRPHDRADLITKLAPVDFDPEATCSQFDAFSTRIMPDAAMRGHLQCVVGYGLTGEVGERCMFIFHGSGANGKTVLIETTAAMLGDYARAMPAATLLACGNDERPRNDVAMLDGVRFASCVESNEGRRLDEALVKAITGGDRISARHLYAEFFTFLPAFKLCMATNHRPEVRGTDNAIWDRIRLIPFNITIPEAERDQTLKARLLTELPGILAWAVRGCLRWQAEGLQPPAEVVRATSEYRAASDHIGDFIAEMCVTGDGLAVGASDLRNAYERWCHENGIEPLNTTAFGRRLNERGFVKGDRCKVTGRIMRRGIGLPSMAVSP